MVSCLSGGNNADDVFSPCVHDKQDTSVCGTNYTIPFFMAGFIFCFNSIGIKKGGNCVTKVNSMLI